MGRHQVSTTITCPNCGKAATLDYVAVSQPSGIRVHTSIACPCCSFRQEADSNVLADDARQAFYAAEGRWKLFVRDLGPNRVEVLRTLRDINSRPPGDILRLIRKNHPLLEGALVEIEGVENLLKSRGADVVVSRI